jgi:hypothetical protein
VQSAICHRHWECGVRQYIHGSSAGNCFNPKRPYS